MKKFFKRKSSEGVQQTETDMPALINKIQAQLVSLEDKLDTLINRSSERHSEEKRFSKPFQRFDRPNRYGQGRRDSRPEERSFTQAVCADCKKECEVPFKPSGDRPVYCRDCFSKRNEGKTGDFASGRSFDRKEGGEKRRFSKRPPLGFRKRREHA